mgnify:CR=1 FL=1
MEMRMGERTAELAESRRYLSTPIDTGSGILFARDLGAGGAIADVSNGCGGLPTAFQPSGRLRSPPVALTTDCRSG